MVVAKTNNNVTCLIKLMNTLLVFRLHRTNLFKELVLRLIDFAIDLAFWLGKT